MLRLRKKLRRLIEHLCKCHRTFYAGTSGVCYLGLHSPREALAQLKWIRSFRGKES